MTLPLGLPARLQQPSDVPEAPVWRPRPLRVLVVDDHVDTVESLEFILNAQGHDVRKSYDGSGALEAALDYQPNIILLDIGLPGIDGYELATRLRTQAVLRDVVLVALTGYGNESARERSLAAGFDHHLTKPTDFKKLEEILATISKNAKAKHTLP